MDTEIQETNNPTTKNNAKIAYILYLVSFIFGITLIIGVVIAYINRADAPQWLKSHYQFQIRTFWIMILYSAISIMLIPVFLIGILVLLFTAIWFIIRCAKGMRSLATETTHPDPTGWMF